MGDESIIRFREFSFVGFADLLFWMWLKLVLSVFSCVQSQNQKGIGEIVYIPAHVSDKSSNDDKLVEVSAIKFFNTD